MVENYLRTAEAVLTGHYIIPAYQRGYRWTQKEIKALLEDLEGFSDSSGFYCLQPLIIKKAIDKQQNTYIVIDGQQRLTTLYLIAKHLEMELNNFSIEYESREKSAEFLMNIANHTDEHSDNIDFFHMHEAYTIITNFFDSTNKEDFINKLRDKVKFIWFETDEDEPGVFKRVNTGKIALADSELIKAKLLHRDDAELNDEQKEIARKWQDMERRLNNESFWSFLSVDEMSVRMDMLMRLAFGDKVGELASNDNPDEHTWRQIQDTYNLLSNAYSDIHIYNLAGFLYARKKYGKYDAEKLLPFISADKSTARDDLKKELRIEIDGISDLEYGENNEIIHDILLLFNMILCDNKGERFNFPEFHKRKWSLEHINPKNPHPSDRKAFLEKYGNGEESLLDDIKWDEWWGKNYGEYSTDFIDNLALLDSSMNSSVNNKKFSDKQKNIKASLLEKNTFIPKGTEYVFLRGFPPSENPEENQDKDFWNKQDKKDYFAILKTTIEKYLGSSR